MSRILYDKLLKKRLVTQIRRQFDDEEFIDGIIINISEEYLHILELNEFEFNGEVIIRKEDVVSIRSNDYDRTIKTILKKEGKLTKKKPKTTNIKLSNWQKILNDIKSNDFHVIVESENHKTEFFTIGPIEKIEKKHVQIRYYDPNGKFEPKTTKIKFKHITRIKFNDRYTKIFRKYLKH